ncbi:MAG: hypothetical protein N2690_11635 [Rhodocyclaceae bacterium]|nr:hypothetical protein [Rhodocyclaceae bacterium]
MENPEMFSSPAEAVQALQVIYQGLDRIETLGDLLLAMTALTLSGRQENRLLQMHNEIWRLIGPVREQAAALGLFDPEDDDSDLAFSRRVLSTQDVIDERLDQQRLQQARALFAQAVELVSLRAGGDVRQVGQQAICALQQACGVEPPMRH